MSARLLTGDASNGRRIRSLNCKGQIESFFRFFPSRHSHQFLGQQVLGCRFRGHTTDDARVGRRSIVVRLKCAMWSPVLCRTDVRSVVLLPPVKSVLTSVDTLTQDEGVASYLHLMTRSPMPSSICVKSCWQPTSCR